MTSKTNISSRQVIAFKHFLDKLPHGEDIDLVLLKGHLLIEMQIRELINRRMRNSSALIDTRFDCHQCICLAQSFFPPDYEPWIWHSLKKLNKMRNDIAHNLEPTGHHDRINEFIKFVPSGFSEQPNNLENFELTLWSLFVAISDLVDSSIAQVIAIDAQEKND